MSENKEKKRSFLARLFGKDKEANKKQPEDEREKHLYDLDDFNIDIKMSLELDKKLFHGFFNLQKKLEDLMM